MARADIEFLMFLSFFSLVCGVPLYLGWAKDVLDGGLSPDYLYKSEAEKSPVIIAADMSVWDCNSICRRKLHMSRWYSQCSNLMDCSHRGDHAWDYCDSSTNTHMQVQRVLLYIQLI
eukprot:Hpha_TRINITY_DN14831_c0_g1::TRINITY_DN14831_c0_g1_i10::g.169873::m.169873